MCFKWTAFQVYRPPLGFHTGRISADLGGTWQISTKHANLSKSRQILADGRFRQNRPILVKSRQIPTYYDRLQPPRDMPHLLRFSQTPRSIQPPVYSGLGSNFRWRVHIFQRQLDFPSEPGVANESLENEPKNCLAVASILVLEIGCFWRKGQIWGWAVAKAVAYNFGQNLSLKAKQPRCL